MRGPEGAPLQQCNGATRLVDLVPAQDSPQMGLVPGEVAVQELAAASPDPAFGNRVHARCRDVAEHGPEAFWQACHGGQRRTAERLLASGADMDGTPGYSDQTPAGIAAEPGTQRESLVTWLNDRKQVT